MKSCSKCKLIKAFNDYHKDNTKKDKLASRCKICAIQRSKEQYDQNKLNPNFHKNQYIQYKDKIKFYQFTHKEQIKQKTNEYNKQRKKEDIQFRLKCNLKTRLNKALRRQTKSGSAIKDLGCSLEDFKLHLESQFHDGMNWDNYGQWHIDHMIPLASFNLEDRQQVIKACHFSNLQPMWAMDNIKKSDKVK